MKVLPCYFLIFTLFIFAKCEKDKPDFNGLPAATQSGKNTLGFMLNGQPWTPQGFNGTANLSIDFDPGVNNGIFSISAYRYINNNSVTKQSIGFGVRDSLKYVTIPATFLLGKNSIFGMTFIDRSGCQFDYFDTTTSQVGQLTIAKLDRTNRIISGTFNATLSKAGCSAIQITDGRFDMKF